MSEVGNTVDQAERARIACPSCGKHCRVDSSYCWNCGHRFRGPAGSSNVERAPSDAAQTGDASTTDARSWSTTEIQRALDDPSTGRDWLMGTLEAFGGLDEEGIRAWGGATRQQLIDAIKRRMADEPIEPPAGS